MKAPLRISIFAITYLLVLALGLYAGFYYGSVKLSQARDTAESMVVVGGYAVFLDAQKTLGTDAAYEEALRGRLALIDRFKGKSEIFTERTHALDSALIYARLAELATKQGATDKAQDYLVRAASFCPTIGWRECSAASIVDFNRRIENNMSKREVSKQ